MHTLHYIAVEAESKQEAFDKVVVSLLPNDDGYRLADWSDWHVVGGGRWSSAVQKSKDFMDSYANDNTDVIGYTENKEKFEKAIEGVLKWRSETMNRNLSEIKTDKFISDIVDYISDGSSGKWYSDNLMNNYTIKQTVDMILGSYIPDSGFYDSVDNTPEIGYLKERLDNPEQAPLQYLVPVDFHF